MTQTEYDVSILIPSYKPDWFAQCLDSCLAQSVSVREIIVSDDCPTDEIKRITDTRLNNPRVRYIRNSPSLGLAANYLQLAREAKGRWLKFFDDDDIMHPDCIARLMQHADDSVSLVMGGCRMIKEDGRIEEKREPLQPVTKGLDYFLKTYPRVPITLFSRMLVRNDVMKELLADNIPPRMISLDELVGLRACLVGDVAWEPDMVCDHRDFSGGYSRNVEPDVLIDDLAYVTNPYERAVRKQLAAPNALQSWRTVMVRKYARGVITKFIWQKDHSGLFTFLARLRERFGVVLTTRCAASPRLVVKFIKSCFK